MAYVCVRDSDQVFVFDQAGHPAFKKKNNRRSVIANGRWVELPPDEKLDCTPINNKPSFCAAMAPAQCETFSDYCQKTKNSCRIRGATLNTLRKLQEFFQSRSQFNEPGLEPLLEQASTGDAKELEPSERKALLANLQKDLAAYKAASDNEKAVFTAQLEAKNAAYKELEKEILILRGKCLRENVILETKVDQLQAEMTALKKLNDELQANITATNTAYNAQMAVPNKAQRVVQLLQQVIKMIQKAHPQRRRSSTRGQQKRRPSGRKNCARA